MRMERIEVTPQVLLLRWQTNGVSNREEMQ